MYIAEIQSLCNRHGIRPSKKWGQNFLIDNSVARKMCDVAELNTEDVVLEIGPGFGALTMEIAKRVKRVVAVEIDKRMIEAARETLTDYKNVEVVNGDILKIKTVTLFADRQKVLPFKVIANLPYSITSAVLRKFTEEEPRPELIVVMVQKEVAERVCAKPGEMSILSVAVQYYGKPEIIKIVPRNAFWPEPEVESAILRIRNYESGIRGIDIDEKWLFQIVRIGFSSRRKQLQNNLSAGLHLPRGQITRLIAQIGLNPKIRAQELSVEDWIALSRVV